MPSNTQRLHTFLSNPLSHRLLALAAGSLVVFLEPTMAAARPRPTPTPVRLPLNPGDRVPGTPAGRPLAILVWAAWSRPSAAEKRLLEELTASGSALAGQVDLVALDLDEPDHATRIAALGGAPALPILYLVRADGVVRRRYVGWPGRNPTAMRAVLVRELTALGRP